MTESDWGWWRQRWIAGERAARAAVVADWMEHHGHDGWARWFREEVSDSDRMDWFFGVFGESAPVRSTTEERFERAMVGAVPVAAPANRFDGPWFDVLHLLLASELDGSPDLEEVMDAPCMAGVRELVVHGHAMAPRALQTGIRTVSFEAFAPLADQLEGLWLLDGASSPAGLADLHRLERLSTPLGPGEWRHPALRVLHTREPEQLGTLWMPSLRHLDIEMRDGGDARALLAQVPSVETLEIDSPLVAVAAEAHALGHLPNLTRIRVWGDVEVPPGIEKELVDPWTRDDIRLTGVLVLQRALHVRL